MGCWQCDPDASVGIFWQAVAALPPEEQKVVLDDYLADVARSLQVSEVLSAGYDTVIRGGTLTIPLQYGPNTK